MHLIEYDIDTISIFYFPGTFFSPLGRALLSFPTSVCKLLISVWLVGEQAWTHTHSASGAQRQVVHLLGEGSHHVRGLHGNGVVHGWRYNSTLRHTWANTRLLAGPKTNTHQMIKFEWKSVLESVWNQLAVNSNNCRECNMIECDCQMYNYINI